MPQPLRWYRGGQRFPGRHRSPAQIRIGAGDVIGRVGTGPGRFKCRQSAGTATGSVPEVEGAEGSGSAFGGPWVSMHPPPGITEGHLA